MSLKLYAALSVLGLISFNAFAAPLLESHSLHKRDLGSEIPEPEVIIKTVTEGHTIELECDADGPAPPVIHWLKDGAHVEQGPLDHYASNLLVSDPAGDTAIGNSHYTKSTLVIKEATSADAGKYTCVADTQTSRVSKSFEVRVSPSAEPRAQVNKRDLSNDVRIYLWTDSAMEEQDTESRLICRATQGVNRPVPEIRWEINGEVVNDDNSESLGVTVHSNGDLEFVATFAMHLAPIRCVAIGSRGDEDVKEPWLYVIEPEVAAN